jgi:hypothetical protein
MQLQLLASREQAARPPHVGDGLEVRAFSSQGPAGAEQYQIASFSSIKRIYKAKLQSMIRHMSLHTWLLCLSAARRSQGLLACNSSCHVVCLCKFLGILSATK